MQRSFYGPREGWSMRETTEFMTFIAGCEELYTMQPNVALIQYIDHNF